HIAGMVALRYLVASLLGTEYRYPWTLGQLLYEFRKDALTFVMITITFLLALRLALWRVAFSTPTEAPASPDLWLHDGAASVRIDAREITWVGSAGNYIEYHLAGGVTHLIRGTLAAEEDRLQPHGIVRVHRTRLVNVRRAISVKRKATGDFEIRLNPGEVVVGSRRYRGALEPTAAISTGESARLDDAKGA
ncbi:MAG TPA: LytTR family DNA-binding domain-containing protein, partial [bacterium]